MLFNSKSFPFVFPPITIFVFFSLGKLGWRRPAATWLFLASLFFYGWDDPRFLVPLILASMAFNYVIGKAVATTRSSAMLSLGVIGDLALLAYFKYANFVTDNLGFLRVPASHIALPIGISFFTFTQIAFLVDSYRGKAREYNPVHYALFVSFFPHLIAGPILHHGEMMPQFERKDTYALDLDAIITGACWFAAGLFKKTVLADGIEPYATAVFNAVDFWAP